MIKYKEYLFIILYIFLYIQNVLFCIEIKCNIYNIKILQLIFPITQLKFSI